MSDLNDPRVFFAAERTLMAWSRTALTLMAFGFVLERFGLFLAIMRHTPHSAERDGSFWLGLAFIGLAVGLLAYSVLQYRRVLKTLRPIEIPQRYSTWSGVVMNLALAGLGVGLMFYLSGQI